MLNRPLRTIFIVSVIAVSALALYALFREIHIAAIAAAVHATSAGDIIAAVAFSVLGSVVLGLYDLVTMRAVAGHKVSPRLAWYTGAKAYAVSNMLGFALLTGGAVRAGPYGARGLSKPAIGGLMALSWTAFWIAVALTAGLTLCFHPQGIAARFDLPPVWDRLTGVVLISGCALLFGWLSRRPRVLRLRQMELRFPPRGLAMVLSLVGGADLATAALSLYVLMPAGSTPEPAAFFVVYTVAVGVGIVSHTPGGLGAFEVTLIAALGLGARPDVLAALMLYRLIRFALPFSISLIVIGAEALGRKAGSIKAPKTAAQEK